MNQNTEKTKYNIQKSENEKNKKKTEVRFEFCKVCNLNHDQGNRHKYFPNHKKSLSSFLMRFQNKLSDVRFFLKNPIPLRPEHASLNRLWCVFCDSEILEIGSSFACENAINHLASMEHLKKLKHFLWKYGGGDKDRLDTFRVLDADLTKWETKCKSLESAVASCSDGSHALPVGPLNDIRNECNREFIDNSRSDYSDPFESKVSNSVMPLQYYTYEYQISHSVAGANVGLVALSDASSLSTGNGSFAGSRNSRYLTGDSQQSIHYGSTISSCSTSDGGIYQDKGMSMGTSKLNGFQPMTQMYASTPGKTGGNVHTGAPPPWFESYEENQLTGLLEPMSSSVVSLSNKPGKSHKLNPKRVGAAWAERRKIELEMEKRGEIVKRDYDADWLPNFGRVWQAGSRKESRKEYEKEKQKLPKHENNSDSPLTIQPYISKRMQRDEGN